MLIELEDFVIDIKARKKHHKRMSKMDLCYFLNHISIALVDAASWTEKHENGLFAEDNRKDADTLYKVCDSIYPYSKVMEKYAGKLGA